MSGLLELSFVTHFLLKLYGSLVSGWAVAT